MKNKKIINKILLIIIAAVILFSAIYILSRDKKAESSGTITIEVIDLNNETLKKKEIEFYEGDTLKVIIENNFNNVYFESSSYGPFLKSIEGYTTPDDYHTYIRLYVNNEYSMVSIGEIIMVDQMIITLKIEAV